ncbi:MAG: hypothetical protein AB7E72_04365 [Lysobacterales bacterium]
MSTRAALPVSALLLPLLLVALIYAPGFWGYWLGDDLTNLHHYFRWAEEGRLWSDSYARFFQGISAEGSAYRPLSILSLSANYAVAGSHYAGWYASNYLVHLGNTLMVALLVLRLAAHQRMEGGVAAVLAALAFGLAPTLAEGVYWLSARADGWVTLLTLTALHGWIGPADAQRPRPWMPVWSTLCLLLALSFKESAAVYPLQLGLLALVWPGRLGPSRWVALALAFALLLLFFWWRAHLFGHAFWVYATPGAEQAPVDWLQRLGLAIGSIPSWWMALTQGALWISLLYLLALLAAVVLLLVAPGRQRVRWLALALFAASGGMVLATILNLGSFLAHGEGGRLSYGPIAWAAVGLGALLLHPLQARPFAPRRIALMLTVLAVLAGGALLTLELAQVRRSQHGLAALVAALPSYVQQNPGYTLLLVPETDGQAVILRNGQGAVALPPLQAEGLLDRVLPTLPSDIEQRHLRLAGGMGTRFIEGRFQHLAGEEVAHLYDPAEPRWPDRYACWSQRERRILALPAPDPADAAAWVAQLRAALPGCAIDSP